MKRAIPLLVLTALMVLDLACGDGFSLASGVVLWKLRLPRMLTAAIAGAAMALCGAQMQALFRNPLADPHIMGVSSGAGLGASVAALAGAGGSLLGGFTMVGAAFAGAFLSAMAVVGAAAKVKSTGTLLLTGVMLGFILSAVSSVLQYWASEESLKLFYSWMAGTFSGVRYSSLTIMAGALLLGLTLAWGNLKGLDLLLFGDSFASFSGLPLKRMRMRIMTGCAIMTGAVTAFCGPVGFIGIAAPHLVRLSMRTSAHRVVVPWSLVYGACFSLGGDIIAHLGPSPLPVGSTLALIGIPFIIWLLWRERI